MFKSRVREEPTPLQPHKPLFYALQGESSKSPREPDHYFCFPAFDPHKMMLFGLGNLFYGIQTSFTTCF